MVLNRETLNILQARLHPVLSKLPMELIHQNADAQNVLNEEGKENDLF